MYDIIKLTPTTILEKIKKETLEAIPANPSPGTKRKTSNLSNEIIHQNTENVNLKTRLFSNKTMISLKKQKIIAFSRGLIKIFGKITIKIKNP